MSIQQREFIKFIKLLDDNDLLSHVILIGSWAEYIYKETNMLPGFETNIKTLDIDFLLKNLRKPTPPQNLAALAKDAGYLVENDILDGTTKILDKEGLEIEFLINKLGAGTEETMKTNLGVTAQALRHMDILIKNTVTASFLSFSITVPSPEAYAVHKMVINKDRKDKQEKDILAVKGIWNYLDSTKLEDIVSTLSNNEKKEVENFRKTFLI